MVRQTMVHLSPELIDQADAEAARRQVSRSQLIRDALTAYLADTASTRADHELQEGYARVPQATEDAWGSVVALAERSTLELLARLDAEEDEPW